MFKRVPLRCYVLLWSMVLITTEAVAKHFSFGVIADCQYADQDDKGARHYRNCPRKLSQAVAALNDHDVEAVIHLGDFIDRNYRSFTPLLEITDTLKSPLYHVLGNHDFSVADSYKVSVPGLLGMPARYYAFELQGWRFVVVDGNDISVYSEPRDSEAYRQNVAYYKRHFEGLPTWNAAIGKAQLAWLSQQLQLAQSLSQPVVILSHFPIFPEDKHNLWNSAEVQALIQQYSTVKAWFNGHNHAGNYGYAKGIHYVTFHAMLDTDETAYSIVTFTKDSIHIQGAGRQPSMRLALD